MTRRDLTDLLLLGALWGASFLFVRMGAAEFGPVALVFLRVAGASLLLLPLMLAKGRGAGLRSHWKALGLVGGGNAGPGLHRAGLPALLSPDGQRWG